MIPRFPAFKPLELSDGPEITAIARHFPPYSDFNFVSLWSWNTTGTCQVSTLNGNLVVRMADYVTGVPFYSFLGAGAVSETAAELLRRSLDEGLEGSLRLVPEVVALALDRGRMKCEMDMDGSDYILSTARIRKFEGNDLRNKRWQINRFVRENPVHRAVALDLSSREVSTAMLDLFGKWAEHKGSPDAFELAEYKAFSRLLRAVDFLPDLHGIGIYLRDRLAAFVILELVHSKSCMAHYWKADPDCLGLYPFLIREIGDFLDSRGYEHLNFQQDLGLPGLRHSKKSYLPAAYLHKYTVVERVAQSRRPSRFSVPAVNEAFLASGLDSFGVSLRPPSLSEGLIRLAREEEEHEKERANVRQSRITVKRSSDGEPDEGQSGSSESKVG